MSDQRPAVQANLGYDHDSGAYAGAFVSSVRLGAEQQAGVQLLGYVGFSARLSEGLSWDAGITYTDFSRPDGYAFGELHAGLSHATWSARLSYAPRYFGRPYEATYAELNVTPGSDGELAPLLHGGLLLSSAPPYLGPSRVWDGRVGLSYSLGLTTVQLSWGTTSHARMIGYGEADRSAWVLRVTRWL